MERENLGTPTHISALLLGWIGLDLGDPSLGALDVCLVTGYGRLTIYIHDHPIGN